MYPNIKDMTGLRFGRLTVLSITPKRHNRCVIWLCKCDCGKTVEAQGSYLRNGETKSCGCLHDETISKNLIPFSPTHGGYKDRLHGVWTSMLTRCRNPNSESYHNYGGRGITVCKEWETSYQAFKDWAYSNGYDENAEYGKCTLDRIDVNGNYCPENCRFISAHEQCKNMRVNRNITICGKTKCLADWARCIGVTPGAIYSAERFHGVPPEKYIKYKLENRNVHYARASEILKCNLDGEMCPQTS